MKKVYQDAEQALEGIVGSSSMMFGGFGLCGIPENSITEIARRKLKEITVISNNCGNQGMGLAVFLKQHQVKKVICSYVGGNPDLEEQMLSGQVEVELNPQGTLAERIRAGGAGIAAFFTPTSVDTVVSEHKRVEEFEGRKHVLETGLKADYAFVKALYGDEEGNLVFPEASKNFSPAMASAGKITIAEVEKLVPKGELDPDKIHTPGIFVDRIYEGKNYLNTIEKKVLAQSLGEQEVLTKEGKMTRRAMAWRASRELASGAYVNLGIGLPTMVADYIEEKQGIVLHSENGVLGVGPYPEEKEVSPFSINAGKETITLNQGGSYFDSATSFAMIRGGHVDYAVLGALEVSQEGDLANWMIPGKKVTGMGGAMDLAAGAKKVIALMTHVSKRGDLKLKENCDLPLTAAGVVDTIITDIAVIDVVEGRFVVREILEGWTMEQLTEITGAPLEHSKELVELKKERFFGT